MNHTLIPGDAGEIEIIVNPVPNAKRGVVLCHPHPLYGGSMHDFVLSAVEEGFIASHVSTLRFNFRGVGASAGRHDRGVGEADDVCTVAGWFREAYKLDDCFLGGYSFGAGIALHASHKLLPPSLVLVAPPLQMLNKLPVGRTLVVLGEQDQIVDYRGASALFEGHSNVRVRSVASADHFFGGDGAEISDAVEAFLEGV